MGAAPRDELAAGNGGEDGSGPPSACLDTFFTGSGRSSYSAAMKLHWHIVREGLRYLHGVKRLVVVWCSHGATGFASALAGEEPLTSAVLLRFARSGR
jgi:hypothetical protein